MSGQEAARTRIQKAKRRRGIALFWLVTLLSAIGGLFAVTNLAEETAEKTQEFDRREQSRLDGVATALTDYALNRADIERLPLNLPSQPAANVVPRLLLLPCPDNLGEATIDGLQDATCGVPANPAILNGGSRFGLLPWNSALDATEADLGLGHPFEDGTGNNYWYSVARNVAPKTAMQKDRPLNLHHLANAPAADWLQVMKLSPVDDTTEDAVAVPRVAAVVIAPGGARAARVVDATPAADGGARAAGFLDAIDTTLPGGAANFNNADNDGNFVDAQHRDGFDDRIRYISADEWWQEGGEFARRYGERVGITEVHNRPAPGSPLEKIREMMIAYHTLLQFYPTPAKNTPANIISNTGRQGAAFHSGNTTIVVRTTLPPTVVRTSLPSPIEAYAVATTEYLPGAGNLMTVIAAQPIAATVINPASTIIVDDNVSLDFMPGVTLNIGRLTAVDCAPGIVDGVPLWPKEYHHETYSLPIIWVIGVNVYNVCQYEGNLRLYDGGGIIQEEFREPVVVGGQLTIAQYARLTVSPVSLQSVALSVVTDTMVATVVQPVVFPANANQLATAAIFNTRTQEDVFEQNSGVVIRNRSFAVRATTFTISIANTVIGNVELRAQTVTAYGEVINQTVRGLNESDGMAISTENITTTVPPDRNFVIDSIVQGDTRTLVIPADAALTIGQTVTITRTVRVRTIGVSQVTAGATAFLAGILDPPQTIAVAIPISVTITIAPGGIILLPAEITTTLRPQTPLVPLPTTEVYYGLLAEGAPPIASHADPRIVARSTAVFSSPTQINHAVGGAGEMVVLSGNDRVIVPANAPLNVNDPVFAGNITAFLDDNIASTVFMNTSIDGYPTAPPNDRISYGKSQLALLLLADAYGAEAANMGNVVLEAPALMSPSDTSKSQTNYPPQLDARNYYEANTDNANIGITLTGNRWVDPAMVMLRTVDTEIPANLPPQAAAEFLSLTVRNAETDDTDRPVLIDNSINRNYPFLGNDNIYAARQAALSAFIEDHPMHYAVSADCLYSGYPCTGNINISVANGATVALSQPYAVAGNADNMVYADDGMRHRVQVNGGIVAMPANDFTVDAASSTEELFTQERDQQVFNNGVLDDALAGTFMTTVNANESRPSRLFFTSGTRIIEAHLQEGQIIRNNLPLILQAGTPIIARSNGITIVNVAALIAFSPAPLPNAECGNFAGTIPPLVLAGGQRIVDQTDIPTLDDMTDPCAWLDIAENNDGDSTYAIPAPDPNRYPLSQSNDFFMFFGGQPNL